MSKTDSGHLTVSAVPRELRDRMGEIAEANLSSRRGAACPQPARRGGDLTGSSST
jgi:hypothetical protein